MQRDGSSAVSFVSQVPQLMGEVKSLRYSLRLGREIAGSGPEGNDGIQSDGKSYKMCQQLILVLKKF